MKNTVKRNIDLDLYIYYSRSRSIGDGGATNGNSRSILDVVMLEWVCERESAAESTWNPLTLALFMP